VRPGSELAYVRFFQSWGIAQEANLDATETDSTIQEPDMKRRVRSIVTENAAQSKRVPDCWCRSQRRLRLEGAKRTGIATAVSAPLAPKGRQWSQI
jgi:hypothetical protein